MRIRCDESMARHKMRASRKGWRCTKDCTRCICALVKMNNGTWEHAKLNDDGKMIKSQVRGETDD